MTLETPGQPKSYFLGVHNAVSQPHVRHDDDSMAGHSVHVRIRGSDLHGRRHHLGGLY